MLLAVSDISPPCPDKITIDYTINNTITARYYYHGLVG